MDVMLVRRLQDKGQSNMNVRQKSVLARADPVWGEHAEPVPECMCAGCEIIWVFRKCIVLMLCSYEDVTVARVEGMTACW